MDASKAFDKVNHGKLLNILQERNTPEYIVRILKYWFNNQLLCVRWGDSITDFFTVTNGVRQGGMLSPYLFNVYYNKISMKLNNMYIGCILRQTLMSHLMYADDIVLFAPSAKGLQNLINCCVEEAEKLDITFNKSKTVYMIMSNSYDKTCVTPLPDVYVHNEVLKRVDCYKYLGHYITSDLKDDKDIRRQIQANYARGNMLSRNFKYCSENVKCTLFRTYMYNMYTVSLWCDFTKSVYQKFVVSYNNTFRFMFDYPTFCSASEMFVNHRVKYLPEAIRTVSNSIMTRLPNMDNPLISDYMGSQSGLKSKVVKRWKDCVFVK